MFLFLPLPQGEGRGEGDAQALSDRFLFSPRRKRKQANSHHYPIDGFFTQP